MQAISRAMSGLSHTIAIVGAIALAYIWLTVPSLEYYALQAFAVAALGYFVAKRFSNAKLWHLLPETHSLEMAFVSFAIVLLVGSTGNAESLFYPFSYVHLFFLVMTTRQNTAIIATTATMIVHYAIEPSITSLHIASLLTLPLMLVFFLFARRQYDDARLQHKLIEQEENQLERITVQEQTLESYITSFLLPKLATLHDLLNTAIHRHEPIDPHILQTQLSILASESQKIVAATKQTVTSTQSEKQQNET